ncbi:MAG: hypothetical protein HY929_02525, partial [Euryarchaeota archaeon]|nr:hypothetical protein [Euryarchaeota archaeon]
ISKLGKPSNEIAMSLLEKVKVVSTAGSAFGENGEGYLRFTYATKKERIEEALRRIASLDFYETKKGRS